MAKRDYEPVFSGKHDNSVLGVANKDYDAAAIANEVMFRMFERKVVDKAKIRTIYKSDTFPTTGYGLAHNLDPELRQRSRKPSSPSLGKAPRLRPSSRARTSSFRLPTRKTGT